MPIPFRLDFTGISPQDIETLRLLTDAFPRAFPNVPALLDRLQGDLRALVADNTRLRADLDASRAAIRLLQEEFSSFRERFTPVGNPLVVAGGSAGEAVPMLAATLASNTSVAATPADTPAPAPSVATAVRGTESASPAVTAPSPSTQSPAPSASPAPESVPSQGTAMSFQDFVNGIREAARLRGIEQVRRTMASHGWNAAGEVPESARVLCLSYLGVAAAGEVRG